jgi:LmbE family N-acetylglucosaminyl deacetylase
MADKDVRGPWPEMTDFFLPPANKVLLLSPHPDDECLGCGGTVFLYTEKGVDVCLAVISRGEKLEVGPENIGEIRRSEATEAAALIGIKKTVFLDFPDEKLNECKGQIKEKLTGIIKDINPDIVFAPFPLDPHPDHRSTSEVALALMRELGGFKLAFYEIYHPIRFNILVDIASVIHKKKEAVLTYRKSLLDIPEIFWHSVKGLNIYRSFLVKRESFYEAFWLIDTPVSQDEIVKWSTYDYKDTPAEIFLSKLRVADELIYELQNVHVSLERKDAEISNLNETLKETEEKMLIIELENQRFKTDLELLKESLFWRFIDRFYRLRNKLLPDGTKGRNIYSRIVGRLKKISW